MKLTRELIEAAPPIGFEDIFTRALPDGLVMEFGVGEGTSIRRIAALTDRIVHGFDSFKGLPEAWGEKMPKGAFACPVPDVPENVRLHIGPFESAIQTVHLFDKIAFVHIDCDLYSSTMTVLRWLEGHFVPGSVLAFDEINDPPHSDAHEFKAFAEYLERTGQDWTCIGRQHQCGAVFRLQQ